MSRILALDQGTSSSRGMVFEMPSGRILGVGQQAFDCSYPQPGWVEQDPELLWRTSLEAAREALQQASGQIDAIGITNQRETTLVWDRATGECLHNAIVWQDRRTADICARMRSDGLEPLVRENTGLLLDPYFSATKLAWLLDQTPGLRRRAEAGEICFGTVDTFLLWRLTGGRAHRTDAANASRTLLFDINRQCWDQELLDYFRIPAELLPEVCDNAGLFGVADKRWFGAEIPITGMAGDQQAALIGQGATTRGQCKSTYGTGCFVLLHTGDTPLPSQRGLITTLCYRLAGVPAYGLEGSIFVAGSAIKWLRDRLGLIERAEQTADMAEAVAGDSGGVYLVPAFTGLGAPWWQPNARAALVGLTLDSGAEQIVTAALQSAAFQTVELLEAMALDGAMVSRLGVDGGMVANNWLCQCLADLLNRPVHRPQVIETTALGAAMLAEAGRTGSPLAAAPGGGETFVPSMSEARRETLMAGWQQAVAQVLAGVAGEAKSGD